MPDITVKTAIEQHKLGNTPEALRQFRLLATPDDPHACYALGYFLIETLKNPSHYKEGWTSVNSASEAGNTAAQEFTAFHKLHGIFLEKDFASAIETYERLAIEGSVSAIRSLGTIYSSHEHCSPNFELAAKWYEEGANQGDDWCQHRLGILQISQESVYNISEGIKNLSKSMRNGNGNAAYELGMIYYTGDGVDTNDEKAVEYFEIASDLGSIEAVAQLGFLYLIGDHVQKNEIKGFELVSQAAETGNAFAQDQLGNCYQYGTGCEESPELAELWYQKAAEQGHLAAMRNLGKLKCNWLGSPKDPSYIHYTIKAATLGDVIALHHLGWHYLEGTVVPQSSSKALALFMLGEALAGATPDLQNDIQSSKDMAAKEVSENEKNTVIETVKDAVRLHQNNDDWLSKILRE